MAASKAIGFLNFKFGADLKGFDRAMKKASQKLKRFGKNIQRTGKSLTMGLTLPLVALGAASIKAFDAQEKAIAQVEAGLKSTGNQVGITSAKLQQMAKDLQETTLFGDEEILQGATAQLLTFTNITGEQFERTQVMVLDLATRLDGDLKSASIMLGKALNDPVKNLSAMTRAGIQFSIEQETLIKSLAATGNMAEAQSLILEELEKQYGGSAEAAANAGMGPIKQLQNQLSDLSEQIGQRLIPFVKDFVSWITKLATKFDGLSSKQKDNIVKWGLILAAIGPVLIIFGKLATGVGGLISAFRVLSTFLSANPYVALAAVVIALSVAIYKVVGALNRQYDSQKNINELNIQAGNRIADDITKIQLLTATIQDENTTLADKKTALNDLKNLYPGYYDEVDEATFSQDTMAESTERLKKQLLGLANIEVFTDRIKEINRELYDLSQSAGEADFATRALTFVGTNLAAGATLGPMGALVGGLVSSYEVATGTFAKELQVNIDNKEIIALNDELTDLTQRVVGLQQEFKVITPKKTQHRIKTIVEKEEGGPGTEIPTAADLQAVVIKDLERLNKIRLNDLKQTLLDGNISEEEYNKKVQTDKLSHLEKLKALYELWGKDVIEIDSQILDAKIALYEREEEILTKATNAQLMLNEGVELFGDILGSSLNSALDNQENFFKVFLDNIKKTIRQLLIQLAIMTMIDVLLGGKNLSKALLQGNAMKVLGLAEGGIVSGPTTALIGEGAGTSMSNPEVVAPLDKLKQYIGGNQNVNVTGRIVGNDIYLSNERTKFNRNRTV